MYPAYPFLALNAAVALHIILGWLGNADPRSIVGRIPVSLKLAVVTCAMLAAVSAGVFRIVGNVTAYQAPLKVYSELANVQGLGAHTSVCLGKEWYRFPSSHFLPNDIHARFVKSDFRGLLPGQFSEAKTGFGLFPGTWLIPGGMNDRNEEDPSKYVRQLSVNQCLLVALTNSCYRSDWPSAITSLTQCFSVTQRLSGSLLTSTTLGLLNASTASPFSIVAAPIFLPVCYGCQILQWSLPSCAESGASTACCGDVKKYEHEDHWLEIR